MLKKLLDLYLKKKQSAFQQTVLPESYIINSDLNETFCKTEMQNQINGQKPK